jgi:tetratricopeptide (TPR) repeat protein
MRQAELERAAESARAEEAGHRVLVERQRRRYQLGLAASIVILSIMGGLSFALWAQQREARVARADLALGEATNVRDQAKRNPDDPAGWEAAAKAVADASRAVREAGIADIEERLATLRGEVRSQLESARRDRKLINALATARDSKQDLRHSGVDAEYMRAFRAAGLDIDGDPAEEIGSKIRARSGAVDAVVAALDDWALERRAAKQPMSRWRRPLEAARAADPDTFRDRARAALLQSEPKVRENELTALASNPAAAELSPQSALLLAAALRELKAFKPAVELLRAVTSRHPDDVWANYELAATLQSLPAGRNEALRYYSEARVRRPETAHSLGHLLDQMGRSEEAVGVFADLVHRRPHDSRHLTCYGGVLKNLRRPEADRILAQAVREGRAEVERVPDDALVHENLAYALRNLGELDESVVEYRKAIRLEPEDSSIHVRLAGVLQDQGKFDEAIASYREAIRLKPDNAQLHVTLAFSINARQSALDPAHRDEVIAELRLAQRMDPEYAEAHCSLAMILSEIGDYAGAVAEAHRGQEMYCQQRGQPFTPSSMTEGTERMLALANRLPDIVTGNYVPQGVDEQVSVAGIAYNRKCYATSAQSWEQAFDAKPALGEDRQAQHRYNAACSAALAAAGKGQNEPTPDSDARVKLRRMALGWLKAELAAWAKIVDATKPENTPPIVRTLEHWRRDTDLASVRDAAGLDLLPVDEQRAYRALWTEHANLLAKARANSKTDAVCDQAAG